MFPTLVAIVGSWFSKSQRGLATGSWATCTNFGNIMGIHTAALILKHNMWQELMYTISVLFIFNCCAIFTVFKTEPGEILIEIQEEEHKPVQMDTVNESVEEEPLAER